MKDKNIHTFLAPWSSYPLDEATWELEDHFFNLKQIMKIWRLTTSLKTNKAVPRSQLSRGGVVVACWEP